MRICKYQHHYLLLLLIGVWLLFNLSNAQAQFSVSERTYKKLAKVEKMLGQKQYANALSILNKLESSSKNRKYELSLVLQALGYLHNQTDNNDKAIKYFEKCLALNSAPEHMLQGIRLNLIRTHTNANNYSKAIKHFKQWIAKEKSPSGNTLALGGSLYAQVKQYDKAVKYLKLAIASSKETNESWLRTLLSIYYQREDYLSANDLIEKLLVKYPDNKQYWNQLFSINYLLKNYPKALAALELAYNKNILVEQNDIINLAKLYIFLDTPMKAAKLIQHELDKKVLNSHEQTLRLLANAYLQGREITQSAQIFLQLAKTSNDPDAYLQSAQLFSEDSQWHNVIQIADVTENNQHHGQFQLLKGIALFELKQFEQAKRSFNDAKKRVKTQKDAEQWLNYLNAQNFLP